jgi:hypothetical protein
MIELIFAIVVIAITVISLPMMVQVNFKGIEGNIKQEAIFSTSAQMMKVLSFAWDSNTTDLNQTLDYARVMDIGTGNPYTRRDINGLEDNTSVFRMGHIRQGLHRRFFDISDTIIPGVGIEDQDYESNLTAVNKDGYKYNMRMRTSVINVSDTIPAGNFNLSTVSSGFSNIKLIQIETTIDSNGDGDYDDPTDDQIILRSYATNIGEIDYNERRY